MIVVITEIEKGWPLICRFSSEEEFIFFVGTEYKESIPISMSGMEKEATKFATGNGATVIADSSAMKANGKKPCQLAVFAGFIDFMLPAKKRIVIQTYPESTYLLS